MIIFQKDNYFFYLYDFNTGLASLKDINKNILNFTLTEELGKAVSGSITFYDPNTVLSRLLRNGMRFKVAFGYKRFDETLSDLTINTVGGNSVRRGINCIIQTVSGGADGSGVITYTITFYGDIIDYHNVFKVYQSGTKWDMVADLFMSIGILDYFIDFPAAAETLTLDNSKRVYESPLRFLYKYAYEEHCILCMGYTPKGTSKALFISNDRINSQMSKTFVMDILSSVGSEKELWYASGEKSNVIDYTWQNHFGENGQGAGAYITLINGQPVIQRYIAETETVLTWKLKPELIEKEMQGKSIIEQTEFLKWAINDVSDFKQIKKYFTQEMAETAPQGQGFTFNINMIGDPLLTMPMTVVFRDKFPKIKYLGLGAKKSIDFFIRKATHTMDMSGYKTSIEVVDSFTQTGSHISNQSTAQ